MAGGGTGGHLFPAIALADEFKRRGNVEILFVGGRGGLEESVVKRSGYPLELLDVEALKNKKGFLPKLKSISKAIGSMAKSCVILRRFKPDGVIGSGSYASGPVVMAARLMGIKTAILEQNALPGFTNRFLGRFVKRAYIAFDDALDFFPPDKTRILGTPVRRAITELGVDGRPRRPGPARSGKFTVFVFGGSQGAAAINAAFLDAAEYLSDIWPGLKVIHQTGREGFTAVEAAYERKGLKVELYRFIEDMASAYSTADLVVSRAGATTIAEINAIGLPAILIPYPFASGDHQRVNAAYLEKRGAAVMIAQERLTGSALAAAIRGFYDDPSRLKKFGRESKRLGRPRAAENIANDFLGL
jgi:UDP-N-acetylglucosamine--N-acetylmuramyl-(pentapeptide) pyrophosphoryl-undecaprenol N-acetylglucosamine transferase